MAEDEGSQPSTREKSMVSRMAVTNSGSPTNASEPAEIDLVERRASSPSGDHPQ